MNLEHLFDDREVTTEAERWLLEQQSRARTLDEEKAIVICRWLLQKGERTYGQMTLLGAKIETCKARLVRNYRREGIAITPDQIADILNGATESCESGALLTHEHFFEMVKSIGTPTPKRPRTLIEKMRSFVKRRFANLMRENFQDRAQWKTALDTVSIQLENFAEKNGWKVPKTIRNHIAGYQDKFPQLSSYRATLR